MHGQGQKFDFTSKCWRHTVCTDINSDLNMTNKMNTSVKPLAYRKVGFKGVNISVSVSVFYVVANNPGFYAPGRRVRVLVTFEDNSLETVNSFGIYSGITKFISVIHSFTKNEFL